MMSDKYFKRNLLRILLFGCAGICSFLLMSCSERKDPYYFLTAEIENQSNKERNIITPYSEQLFEYSQLLFPVLLENTEEGIFVLDVADDSKVSKFNWNFELDTKIGLGPGEIRGVNDIHVKGDTLYLTDAGNALIHLYTIDNEFIRSISIDNEIATQVTTLGDLLIVKTGSDERPLFIDNNGTPVQKGESISSDGIRYRNILESRLFSDDEYLFRMPSFFGLFVKYNQQGSMITAKRLIDASESSFDDRSSNPEEQPPFVQRDDAIKVTLSASFNKDKLCLLRYYRDEGDRFIDCYDKSNLEYLFSFIPPENTMDFKIHTNYFTAIHDSSLTVWEWDLQGSF